MKEIKGITDDHLPGRNRNSTTFINYPLGIDYDLFQSELADTSDEKLHLALEQWCHPCLL